MNLEVDPVMVTGGYRIIDTDRTPTYQGVAIAVQRNAHPVIADCEISHFEAFERALVMAAAPELLQALKDLFSAGMETCMRYDGKDDQLEAVAKARADIQRATASPMGKE